MSDLTLTIVVPAGRDPAPLPEPSRLPKELRLLLARAVREPAPEGHIDETLFQLFGAPVVTGRDLPVAAVTRLSEGDMDDDRWWLRADPVVLQVDRDAVLMVSDSVNDLSADDARQLYAELAPLFTDRDAELQAFGARWFVAQRSDPGIRTRPAREVVGHDVLDFMPDGEHGAQWRGLLNEVQMVLHSSAVNQRRLAAGQLPVNSLWFWGGGRLPAAECPTIDRAWSDDPLTAGLARLCGIPCAPPPADATGWLSAASGGRHLVRLGSDGPGQSLAMLNESWFAPLLDALKSGRLAALTINPLDGFVYTTTARRSGYWWVRRPKFE